MSAAHGVQRVAVVGTGVIGASWTAYFLAQGLDVNATDPSPGAEERLRQAVAQHWPTLERFGLAAGASVDRLRFHDSLEDAVSVADFVQENGPERMDFKIELFRRMDAAAPPDAILASSSSGLAISGVQSGCAHPQRVVLGHPFNPPHLIPLVEVIGGERTSADTIERTMAFYAAIGKRPIHVKREVKGHIANRLQAALWREAFHLVEQGVASVADIDTAIAHGPGLRWAVMGPFMNLHLSGGAGGIAHVLAHLGGPIEDWWKDLGAPSMTPALQAQVSEGVAQELGARRTAELEAARDTLLLNLIRAKAGTGTLD
ncbi:3-hydroxyacyl-CoA dehydrogenase [Variovorax paradoxus]|jgi:3-hydroxyacyl-CoA dehydrogenase|uniref:3-hydroxyacyl-CoA dehydrogenase NAD-binding domain-containing protein n=1 Tax=Variovorax paradoxus TaxID=34073 RepID=UPI0006E4B092|nr:3-hydroxyacyl-CoA dehydrogenase [Variovorax paradoxus]KPU98652.1 3-hydroxyacyl-CoA dehydrogenase [Variovorax paradoxus]KPV08308.1 3-hydroxyacyl-CoA dehydrogenase [Variovorax paradoxus]KPV25483.1 3-hydroxyacyl-CoA dehydrogenase [Variovorax paradoxus]KPV25651.1 3-hydroxyacyl-CoA dehydrogenase [Variovorax paradoxus]